VHLGVLVVLLIEKPAWQVNLLKTRTKSGVLVSAPRRAYQRIVHSRQLDTCPLYFISRRTLGELGRTTALPENDVDRLTTKWERHPAWASLPDVFPRFSGFCPEVMLQTFGVSVSSLHEYTDESDRDLAHSTLGRMQADASDWRWAYDYIRELHYSDCPVYAILLQFPEPESRVVTGFTG